MALNIDTTERDWSRGIDQTENELDLFKFIETWMPYVSDAYQAASSMTPFLFKEFKEGLKKERKNIFAGEIWADRFGALLMPENLMTASLLAEKFHAPLVICLSRMEQEGLLKGPRKANRIL